MRHGACVLSCPRGMLSMSLQHPDCSPSTGGRSGRTSSPEWPAKMTEDGVGECIAPHTEATESPYSARPLTLSGHNLRSI